MTLKYHQFQLHFCFNNEFCKSDVWLVNKTFCFTSTDYFLSMATSTFLSGISIFSFWHRDVLSVALIWMIIMYTKSDFVRNLQMFCNRKIFTRSLVVLLIECNKETTSMYSVLVWNSIISGMYTINLMVRITLKYVIVRM